MTEALRERLALVLVSPGDRAPDATAALVAAALDGGVTAVLLREPQLDPGARRRLYARCVTACRAAGALALVSRDVQLALDLEADGVHCGHAGPTVAEVRAQAPGRLVGRSAHWPLLPDDRAADWVTLSPVAPTPRSHPRPLLLGAEVCEVVAALDPRPVVALGGLDAASAARLPAGLAGVAVLRAIADADDPALAARQLRDVVDRLRS